jgi:ferric-dicitrate binding protein FerR (iron transport regulator)
MAIDTPLLLNPGPTELAHDVRDARRRRRRRFLLTVLTLAALIGALVIVGSLVDPTAGAAGGCGGG